MLLIPKVAVGQSGGQERIVFILHDASPASGVLRMFDSMHGQLGELELDIRTAHRARGRTFPEQARQAAQVARAEDAQAVFWFDSAAPDSLIVYALHRPSGRVFARQVALAGEPTVQREQLAIVLRAAVPAVLFGSDDLGAPVLVVPSERAAPQTAPGSRPAASAIPAPGADARATSDSSALRWRALLSYSGTTIAPDADWQSGILGEVLLDTRWGGRASVAGGYAAPATIDGDGADAVVTRTPITARAGFGWTAGPMRLGLEGGLLADAWHREATVQSPELRPTGNRTHWRIGSALAMRLELFVTTGVGLHLLAEAAWFPAPHELRVLSPAGERTLATRTLRPHVSLGATFDLTPRVRDER
ncbi:MAG: hypothetical protein PVI30_05735 [Myxococcales bacterium]|jgi:hypothetical protein